VKSDNSASEARVLSAGEVGTKAEEGSAVALALLGVESGELLEGDVATLKGSISDEDSSPGSSSNGGGTSKPSHDCI
jgi:hypothetical protein